MKRIALAVLLAATAAPAMAETPRAAIDKANAAWMAAFDKGDAAGTAAIYAPDATVLPPGGPLAKGRPAIQAFWQSAIGALKHPQLKTTSFAVSGKFAREIGELAADMGGKPITGKYVVVWKKLGDTWMIDSDIWNTNQ